MRAATRLGSSEAAAGSMACAMATVAASAMLLLGAAAVHAQSGTSGVPVQEAAAPALSAAADADMLRAARAATEARRFDEALRLFEQLLRARPNDADLLIETARVHGYADRHVPAISTYRRVLDVAPARRHDVLPSLAWQTLWSGDAALAWTLFAEALTAPNLDARTRTDLLRGDGEAASALGDLNGAERAYRLALSLEADAAARRDLRRRLAMVFLWRDDLTAAEAAWRELLAEDPADRRSRAGLARVLNAAGRHAQASRLLAGLDDGTDAELRLEHARARRWAGDDRGAWALLAGRTDPAAVWLRDWRLAREVGDELGASLDLSTDRDRLDAMAAQLHGGHWFTPTLQGVAAVRSLQLDEPGRGANVQRVTARLSAKLGSVDAALGWWVPSLALHAHSAEGWHPVTAQVGVRGAPADGWRVGAELGRELIETPLAISNRITADTAALSVDHRPAPRWSLGATVAHLSFSDDNTRDRLGLRGSYLWRSSAPRVELGVEAMTFRSSRPASDAAVPPAGTTTPKGYWNPRRYTEGRAFIALEGERQPWEWQLRLALGHARETDGDGVKSTATPHQIEAAVAHDLGPGLRVRLHVGASGAGFGVGGGGAGYWRRHGGVAITGWF